MHTFRSRLAVTLAASFFAFTQAILPGGAHPVSVSRVEPPHLHGLPVQVGKIFNPQTNVPVGIPHSLITTNKISLRNESRIIYYLSAKTNGASSGSGSNPSAGTVSTTAQPGSVSDATQQIENVIEGDWSAWTGGNSSTKLTIAEVSTLLANPNITGSQASVLGMLAQQMYSDAGINTRSGPAYSMSQALAYVLGTATTTNALFTGAGPQYYILVMSQVASGNPSAGVYSLYGGANAPIISTLQQQGIQQQEIGDCFFLSAVNSALNQNSAVFGTAGGSGGMISQTGNSNTFLVTFPNGGGSQTVHLTPSEIAAFSQTAPGNGCWLAVLGMAENQVLYGTPSLITYVPSDLKSAPLGIISDGGYPSQTLGLLTGVPYTDYGAGLSKFTLSSVNALLNNDLNGSTPNIPINIESKDHSLSIIGFNSATDTVTILNPWGINGIYGASDDPGVSNPKMEVNMTNGIFTLTVSQMLSDFYTIGLETSLISSLSTTNGNGGPHGNFGAIFPGANPATVMPSSLVSSLPQTTSLPQLSAPALNSTLLNSSLIQSNFNQSALTQSMEAGAQSANAGNTNGPSHSKSVFSPIAWTTPSAPTSMDIPVYDAGQGSMLVVGDHPVVVHTARADVQIAPHAAALVVQLGDEIAVMNLCDQRFGDVSVEINGNRQSVAVGKTLLLAPSGVSDASKMVLGGAIEGRQSSSFGTFSATNAFMGKASYLWAIKSCPQFREMMHSTDPTQRAAALKVLKTGAAFMALAQ